MNIAVGTWMVVIGKGLGKVVEIQPDGSVRLFNRDLEQGWVCPGDRLHDALRPLPDRATVHDVLTDALTRGVPDMSPGDRRVVYSRSWRSGAFAELVDAARLAVTHGDPDADRKARQIVAEVAGEIARGSALDVAAVAALLPHVLRGGLPVEDLFDVDSMQETVGDPSIGNTALDRDLTGAGFPRLAEHHVEAWELARSLAREPTLAELALRGWLTSFDAEGFYDAADYEEAIAALLRAGGSDVTVSAELTDDQFRVVLRHPKGETTVTAEYTGSKWADVDLIKKAAAAAFGRTRKVQVFDLGQVAVLAAIPAAAARYCAATT